MTHTTTEAEWDDYERALVDAYLDFKADLHSCGHPLSDSLLDHDSPGGATYRAGFSVCAACLALHRAQTAQQTKDEAVEKSGGSIAHIARIWQIFRRPDPDRR